MPVRYMFEFSFTDEIIYHDTSVQPRAIKWYNYVRSQVPRYAGDSVRYTKHSYINFIFPTIYAGTSNKQLQGVLLAAIQFNTFYKIQYHKIYFVYGPRSRQGLIGLYSTINKFCYYTLNSESLTTTKLDRQYIHALKMLSGGFKIILSVTNKTTNLQHFWPALYFKFGSFPSHWTKDPAISMAIIFYTILTEHFPNGTLEHSKPEIAIDGQGVVHLVVDVSRPEGRIGYYVKTHSVADAFITCDYNRLSFLSFKVFLNPFKWDLWCVLSLGLASITLLAKVWFKVPAAGIMIISYLLEQCDLRKDQIKNKAFHWILSSFLIVTMVVINEYKGQLTTELTAPGHSGRPETFPELANNGFGIYLSLDSGYANELTACLDFVHQYNIALEMFFLETINKTNCMFVAREFIQFTQWLRQVDGSSVSDKENNSYKLLSSSIRGVGNGSTALCCSKNAYVLQADKVELQLLQLRQSANVNNSKVYQGTEKIAQVDHGIQIKFMEEDGGHLKERMHGVVQSGLYNQWRNILRQYEIFKLQKGINKKSDAEGSSEEMINLEKGLAAVFALSFVGLATSIVMITVELVAGNYRRIWCWVIGVYTAVRHKFSKKKRSVKLIFQNIVDVLLKKFVILHRYGTTEILNVQPQAFSLNLSPRHEEAK